MRFYGANGKLKISTFVPNYPKKLKLMCNYLWRHSKDR